MKNQTQLQERSSNRSPNQIPNPSSIRDSNLESNQEYTRDSNQEYNRYSNRGYTRDDNRAYSRGVAKWIIGSVLVSTLFVFHARSDTESSYTTECSKHAHNGYFYSHCSTLHRERERCFEKEYGEPEVLSWERERNSNCVQTVPLKKIFESSWEGEYQQIWTRRIITPVSTINNCDRTIKSERPLVQISKIKVLFNVENTNLNSDDPYGGYFPMTIDQAKESMKAAYNRCIHYDLNRDIENSEPIDTIYR